MIKRLKDLKSEVTPLVAYGGVVLLSLLVFLGVSALSDRVGAQRIAVLEVQSEVQKLRGIQAVDVWEARLAQSETLKAASQKTVWSGATSGVIAATLQQDLRGIARDSQFSNLRLSTDPNVETLAGQDILNFNFSASVPAKIAPNTILMAIAAQPQAIIINDISFLSPWPRRAPSRLTVSGFIPVTIEPAAQESDL